MTLCRGNPLWLPFVVKYLFICASVLMIDTKYIIKNQIFILCGTLWHSVCSIPCSSFCAQKLEHGMLKKKVVGDLSLNLATPHSLARHEFHWAFVAHQFVQA